MVIISCKLFKSVLVDGLLVESLSLQVFRTLLSTLADLIEAASLGGIFLASNFQLLCQAL